MDMGQSNGSHDRTGQPSRAEHLAERLMGVRKGLKIMELDILKIMELDILNTARHQSSTLKAQMT